MKKLFLLLLLPICLFGQIVSVKPPQILPLTFWEGNPDALFDNDLSTKFFPTWNMLAWTPSSVVIIELLAPHNVTNVRFYDLDGNQTVKIEATKTLTRGEPKILIYEGATPNYGSWKENLTNVTAQYIWLTMETSKAEFPPEFQVVGTPMGPFDLYPNAPVTLHENIFGTNTFVWVPQKKFSFFPKCRIFFESDWISPAKDQTKFKGAKAHFDDDSMYAYKSNGIEPMLTVIKSAGWFLNTKDGKHDDNLKPITYGADPTDPASYKEYSRLMYQISARYGKTKVNDTCLKLQAGQPRLSGLNLLNKIEIQNESDKWWSFGGYAQKDLHYTPFEQFALISAAYDGDEGRLGTLCGAKAADPNMMVIHGGLARPDYKYILLMKTYARWNRKDGKLPTDAINFHFYCNDACQMGCTQTAPVVPTKATEPSACKLDVIANTFVKNTKTYVGDYPVLISEFGFSTPPVGTSGQTPPVPANKVDSVQGAWLIKSFDLLLKSGVDIAYFYHINDMVAQSNTQGGWDEKCGIIRYETENYAEKAAYQPIKKYVTSKLTPVVVPPVVIPPVVVPPIVIPPVSTEWKVEYFNNTTLTGTPVLTKSDSIINYNWGSGSPSKEVTPDNFSMRATILKIIDSTNTYTFITTSDDGERLFVDGVKVIDDFVSHGVRSKTYSVAFKKGETHLIVLEYFEATVNSSCKLEWSYPLTTTMRVLLK